MSKTTQAQVQHSLAAAFASSTPIKQQQQPSNKSSLYRNTSNGSSSENCSCDASSCCGDSNSSTVSVSPYATYTQDISGPSFVPVFSSVNAILPHHNNSAKGQVPWKCSRCDTDAFGHKCTSCNRSRDTAALRVFMGQLSKEGDVELITKMLEVLCPEISLTRSLLHIEPHTHAGSGRGKGCAWVYVSSLQEVLYLVKRLHKRTYPTVNAQTGEVGFVAFPDSYTESDIKAAFDNDVTFLSQNMLQLFHRSPITAEVPLSLQRSLDLSDYNAPACKMPIVVKNQVPQQQQQEKSTTTVAPVQQQESNNTKKLATGKPKPFIFRSFAEVSPASETVNTSKPQFPAPPVIVDNNTNTQKKQQQEQVSSSSSSFKRYRWNPYSTSSVRVGVHH